MTIDKIKDTKRKYEIYGIRDYKDKECGIFFFSRYIY